jgi:hypothetical protein
VRGGVEETIQTRGMKERNGAKRSGWDMACATLVNRAIERSGGGTQRRIKRLECKSEQNIRLQIGNRCHNDSF